MAEKIVVALGGNALQSGKAEPTAEAQLAVVKESQTYPKKATKLLLFTETDRRSAESCSPPKPQKT